MNGLPSAEQVAAIVAENRIANASRTCPACRTGPGVDCTPECPLYELSREQELCDECGGDVRLCGCYWKYAPEPERRPCHECGGSGCLSIDGVAEECDMCGGDGHVEAGEDAW